MNLLNLKTTALLTAALTLAACGGAEKVTDKATEKAGETVTKTAQKAAAKLGADDGILALAAGDGSTSYSEAPTGTYDIEKNHAYITFSYTHQGYSRPFLRWKDWDSTLEWNAEDPAASSVSVDIDVNKIDSGVDIFDDHLRAPRWFDQAQFPGISFKSTEVKKLTDRTGTITGDLTIKGVTKPVTLDVVFNKAAFDGRAKTNKIGFSARGKLNRSEWTLGGGVPAISDNVDLIIETEYTKRTE